MEPSMLEKAAVPCLDQTQQINNKIDNNTLDD